jgi:hypothetical protein
MPSVVAVRAPSSLLAAQHALQKLHNLFTHEEYQALLITPTRTDIHVQAPNV